VEMTFPMSRGLLLHQPVGWVPTWAGVEMTFPMSRGLLQAAYSARSQLPARVLVEMTFPMSRGLLPTS